MNFIPKLPSKDWRRTWRRYDDPEILWEIDSAL